MCRVADGEDGAIRGRASGIRFNGGVIAIRGADLCGADTTATGVRRESTEGLAGRDCREAPQEHAGRRRAGYRADTRAVLLWNLGTDAVDDNNGSVTDRRSAPASPLQLQTRHGMSPKRGQEDRRTGRKKTLLQLFCTFLTPPYDPLLVITHESF